MTFSKTSDAGGVLGIEGRHQAVEEAAPVGGRAGKQPVHGRREPQQPHVLAQGAGTLLDLRRRSPPARPPTVAASAWPLQPVPSDTGPFRGFDLRCNGPGCRLPPCRARSSKAGAAQAAARRQQRDGLQQIGLARAIGARQGNEPARRRRSRRPA